MKVSLPIDAHLDTVVAAIKAQPAIVVSAAPGTGKTTRLPPALLSITKGKILVLEPRRLAATSAARRIADENGWTLGREIGYQVRFESKQSEATRLLFMTEALLLKHFHSNPNLDGIDIIIIDEFHERSIYVDMALALLKEAQDLGSKVKVVVMSATLQAEKISSYLNNAPILNIPVTSYPLEVMYHPTIVRLQTDTVFYKELSTAIKTVGQKTDKDILVFLPGTFEIQRATEVIEDWAKANSFEILPLHGNLTLEEQTRVVSPSKKRKLILSTNIAESSITIDGVNAVVDSGLQKINSYDLKTGFSGLHLTKISLSSAIQRAGRAARQYPGLCYRMWHKSEEASQMLEDVPEVKRIDLSESLLTLSALGISKFESFSWFESPQTASLKKFSSDLQKMNALDSNCKITTTGLELLKYPLHPSIANVIVTATKLGATALGCEIAAILQERDFVIPSAVAAYVHENFECDISFRHFLLKQKSDTIAYRRQVVEDVSNNLKRIAKTNRDDDSTVDVKNILLQAFHYRLCKRRGKSNRALLLGGRGVVLEESSLVKHSDLFIALSGRESRSGSDSMISYACGVSKQLVTTSFHAQITKKEDIYFDSEKDKFLVKKYRAYFDLPIEDPIIENANSDAVKEKMQETILNSWDWLLKENSELMHWWERYLFFTKHVSEAILDENQIKNAIDMASMGESDLKAVAKKDWIYFLEAEWDQNTRKRFHVEVPANLQVPSGSKIKIHYPQEKAPYLEVRVQEVFGLKESPKVLNNQIAIVFHLLAPNYRPTQVTSDLSSFWRETYPIVRQELRIKYPKHSWPEDPLTALAVAKGRSNK